MAQNDWLRSFLLKARNYKRWTNCRENWKTPERTTGDQEVGDHTVCVLLAISTLWTTWFSVRKMRHEVTTLLVKSAEKRASLRILWRVSFTTIHSWSAWRGVVPRSWLQPTASSYVTLKAAAAKVLAGRRWLYLLHHREGLHGSAAGKPPKRQGLYTDHSQETWPYCRKTASNTSTCSKSVMVSVACL